MNEEIWRRIAVIGAAGKMGRGISLLLLQEMARIEAELTGSVGKGGFRLHLIDPMENSLYQLRSYFKQQLTSYAEKNIIALRNYYANQPKIVSNAEVISAFVEGALNIPHYDVGLNSAKECYLIFEAIVEDVQAKVQLFKALKSICQPRTYYFSNTSSIPLSILNEKADLNNQLIGFHFYNPPPVQKLVELISYKQVDSRLYELAINIGERLNKTIVEARDVAGFIGNGYFLREVLYACSQVEKKSKDGMRRTQALYMINKVTQDYLLRPMGLFQLLDYVGIDIAYKITQIMREYLPDPHFKVPLLDEMLQAGKRGGQNADGTQIEGFLQYDKSGPIAIYSLDQKGYKMFPEIRSTDLDSSLGPMPEGYVPWKSLVRDSAKQEKIQVYLANLFKSKSAGSEIAKQFLLNEKSVASSLVKDGVAKSIADVSTVLKNGFFHLYGPDNIPNEKGEVS